MITTEQFLANVRAVNAVCPSAEEIAANWEARAEALAVEGQSVALIRLPRQRPAPKFTTQDEETPA